MSFLKNIFAKKEDPIKSYEDFWNWFQKNEKAFFKVLKEQGNIERDFFEKLSVKLNELKDGYFYLAGMYDDQTAELVITADGTIKNIVFVEELVKSAHKMKGWIFTALKPSLDIENVSIVMGDYKFCEENLNFYSNDHSEYPDEIDITIVHNDLNEENRSSIITGTNIFLDNYLGEFHFATTIDQLTVIGKSEAQKELVPIRKLKDFLIWRQKEFIEKYEGLRYNTENDTYSTFDAELKNGNHLVAAINSTILEWDCKASHPWILNVEIMYDGKHNNGMPDKKTMELLEKIQDEIIDNLKDFEGYLNIGRQTADNIREIYFACKDFRKPSKILQKIKDEYSEKIKISFDIYKDKYWQSFNRFNNR